MYRHRAAGHNKRVFAGTPVADIGDFFENCNFCRIAGLHELSNIYLEVAACCPHRQTHRPGGFSDPLSIIDVNKAQSLIFDEPRAFL